MTRTRPGLLVLLALGSAVVTVAVQMGLAAVGLSKLVPQVTLSATLVLIAVVVVVLALLVRRATRARSSGDAPQSARHVDPFYATRVVLVAKASAVAGALLGGAAAGFLVELLIRPVTMAASVWAAVAMLVASVLLMIAGLLAESWCALPPDDDDKHPAASAD